MNINVRLTDYQIECIKRDWTAWWAGELERPIIQFGTWDQRSNRTQDEYTKYFLLEKPVNEVLDYYQAKIEATNFYGDALPVWFPPFGPGILAGFLGGYVRPTPEQCTVWFESPKPVPFESLHFVFNPDNIWWKRVLELTRGAVERWQSRVFVGFTDLGGILDVLASFRTTNQLLYDVISAPDEVIRVAGEIRSLWLRYYDELYAIIKNYQVGTTNWAGMWSPGRTYMNQCDFSYMISPKMFARFALPDLTACFKQLDHAFYHLDGKGAIPHLDMLLAQERLDGIQWVPGAGQPTPQNWPELLKRIRDAGKLCQVFVSPKGARTIVREIGGRGFDLIIITPSPMSPTEAKDLLKVLADEDISLRG